VQIFSKELKSFIESEIDPRSSDLVAAAAAWVQDKRIVKYFIIKNLLGQARHH